MISEKIILKNLGYVSLITLLAALYIGNRFHAEKLTRETGKTSERGQGSQGRIAFDFSRSYGCCETIGGVQAGQGKRSES